MTGVMRMRGAACDAMKMSVDGHNVVCAEYSDGSFGLWRDGQFLGVWKDGQCDELAAALFSEMARLDRDAKKRRGTWQPIQLSNGLRHVPLKRTM